MSLSANFQKVNQRIFPKGQHQEAAAYLGQLALSGVSPADLTSKAASLITQVLQVEFCLLWDLVGDGQSLLFRSVMANGEESPRLALIPLERESLEEHTLYSPYPIVMNNFKIGARFTPSRLILDQGMRSGVSVRIGTVEQPYGIIEVFSRQAQFFSQSDVHFLQNVANIIGLARHQGRCFQDQAGIVRDGQVRAKSLIQPGKLEWDRYEIKNRLIESRERERLRLAQDLHDAPIQDLYGMIYQLDDLREALKDQESEKILDECDHTLHRVVNSLRSICRELRPPSLSPFGLQVAIRDHVEKFRDQNPDIKVNLELMEDKQILSDSLRLTLFRIYQQAIYNVARHAQATEAHIRFRWDEKVIVLEVEDNGVGFKVPEYWVELAREEHLGLLGIAERVESVQGKLEIVSALGAGTLIRVVVPHS